MVWPSHHRLAQNKYDLEKINVEWLMPKKITTSASDPANFVHQLPQKESGGKIWLQIPPTFFISSLKKFPAKNYMAPDPANFLPQLPQKESSEKLYGSRSRQRSSSAPSKSFRRKIIWLQIPPTFFIS